MVGKGGRTAENELRGKVQKNSAKDNLMQHSTLPHTATHCNALKHTALRYNTLQYTATHYNTLQLTAMHCNTLQPIVAR